jgi:hypothetical protein
MAVHWQAESTILSEHLQLPEMMAWMDDVGPIRTTGKPTSIVCDESKLFEVLIKKSCEFLARHVLDRGSIM